MQIVRIGESFGRWDELLSLILSSFAYMDDMIDPPSSAYRLTPVSLAQKAAEESAFVALDGGILVGCIFLKPEPDALYVGKLAVATAYQNKGIGRLLMHVAEEAAQALQRPVLRLETRIELTGNHEAFARLGFRKTAERSHPGFTRTTFIEMRKDLA